MEAVEADQLTRVIDLDVARLERAGVLVPGDAAWPATSDSRLIRRDRPCRQRIRQTPLGLMMPPARRSRSQVSAEFGDCSD